MPLIKIKEGSLADSNTLNSNFDFLNREIGDNTFSKYNYDQTYSEGDFVTVVENGFLTAFKSKQNDNIGNPVTDTNYWEKVNISSTGSFNMFDIKVTDCELTGMSAYGWALQGTYVYKTSIKNKRIGYPDFYNKCVSEKRDSIAHSVELGGKVVTLYRNTNGHEFYDIKDKPTIDTFFETFGIADFYGVDISSERIFLPRNRYYHQLTISKTLLNTSHGSTMPEMESSTHTHTRGTMNITGYHHYGQWGGADSTSGAFSVENAGGGWRGDINNPCTQKVVFDASKNWLGETSENTHNHKIKNTTQGSNITPPSSYKFLYYCVGNTLAEISVIDVIEQTEAGIKELDDKKNESLLEIENKKGEISSLGEQALQNISLATGESTTTITNATNISLEEINQNAITKTDEFNTNAAEKEAIINGSIDNARIYASGTDEEVSALTGIPGSKSSKGYMEEAAAIVVDGIINDNIPSLETTYSSTKIEELVKEGSGGVETYPIHVNPINPNEFYTDVKASEIRALVYEQSKDVRLSFEDTITNTGEQIYSFETFDKANYAVFRRNVIDPDTAERINIRVDNDKKVTFTTTTYDGILANGSKSMTGALKFEDSGYIEKNSSPSTKGLALFGDIDGYGNGASIALRSNTASGSQAGAFKFETGNNVTGHTHTLQGSPDGSFTCDGKEIIRSINGKEASKTGEIAINDLDGKITNCILEAPNGVMVADGSTFTIKQGLKLLCPNKKNSDGSLKNEIITLSTDESKTINYNQNTTHLCFIWGGNEIWDVPVSAYYEQDEQPNISPSLGTVGVWLDTKNNIFKITVDNATWYEKVGACVGYIDVTSSNIVTARFSKPINLLKQTDKDMITAWSAPSDRILNLTMGINGATYTAPANGYFHCRFHRVAPSNSIQMYLGELFSSYSSGSGGEISATMRVAKGQTIAVYQDGYNTNDGWNKFIFVYTEGDK